MPNWIGSHQSGVTIPNLPEDSSMRTTEEQRTAARRTVANWVVKHDLGTDDAAQLMFMLGLLPNQDSDPAATDAYRFDWLQ